MPVDNDISDNTYCHEGSLNLTQPLGFMNVDAETVHSWMSTMSNVRNSFHNQQARIIFFFSVRKWVHCHCVCLCRIA